METTTKTSEEEYFKLLEASDVKLEYHDGEIVAMAGAQPKHNFLINRLVGLLFQCLEKNGCASFNSDQLITVPGCEKFVFPDIVIVCMDPQFVKNSRGLNALMNPEIIIEVLSDSTEVDDRNEKFDCYKTIDSFREYVLVSTKRKKIEVFKKITQNEWLVNTAYDEADEVVISNCKLLLKDIYKNAENYV